MAAPIQLLFDLSLNDLNPISVGESTNLPDQLYSPKSFNGTVIHHVRNGRGRLFIKDRCYDVQAGQGFIILPGQEHDIYCISDHDEPWEYAWISFTGRLAPQFSLLEPVFDMPENTFSHTYGLKNATDTIGYLLASDLLTLYAKLVEPLLHTPDIIPEIIEYIETHYMQKLSAEVFSERFGLDRRELSKRFKERTELSIRAYLTQVRMKQAQALLLKGYSTKEIAERCGFSSVSSFHKLFTAHHHTTPQQWKRLHQHL